MLPTQGRRMDHPGEDRVPVELVCLFCSRVEVIHVPRGASPGNRIAWECLHCQETVAQRPVHTADMGPAHKGPTPR